MCSDYTAEYHCEYQKLNPYMTEYDTAACLSIKLCIQYNYRRSSFFKHNLMNLQLFLIDKKLQIAVMKTLPLFAWFQRTQKTLVLLGTPHVVHPELLQVHEQPP